MLATGAALPIVKDGRSSASSRADLVQSELDERDQEIRLSNEYPRAPCAII